MTHTIKDFPDHVVVIIDGRLDSDAVGAFGEVLTVAGEKCNQKLVIDLSGVDFISSACLGQIIKISRTMAKKNCGLEVSGMGPFIKEALKIVGLGKYIAAE